MQGPQLINFAFIEPIKEHNGKALRVEELMQSELFEHFAADNHNCSQTDCNITLIDKTDRSDPTRREEYW